MIKIPSVNISRRADSVMMYVFEQENLSSYTEAIDFIFAKAGYFTFEKKQKKEQSKTD